MPGYKTAWLLWPASDSTTDGEIDFPEGDLDGTISAFMHHQGGGSQDAYTTTGVYTDWHVAVIEWGPVNCVFLLDDVEVGHSTAVIPNTPMHWIIQTETQLSF